MIIKLYLKKTFNYQASPRLDMIIKLYLYLVIKIGSKLTWKKLGAKTTISI